MPGPGVVGHVGQRLPGGVHDGPGHGLRDVQLARGHPAWARSPDGHLEVHAQAPGPHLAGHRLDVRHQAGPFPGGRGRGIGGGGERVLQQRDVVLAAGYQRLAAAPAADRGERVQHRVVHQPLVLTPFDVPGQDHVLIVCFLVGGGEAEVGPGSPPVEHAAAGPVHGQQDEQQRPGHQGGVPLVPARRGHRGARPVRRLRGQAQQHGQQPRRKPDDDDDLAGRGDVEPVAGQPAHVRRNAGAGPDRQCGIDAGVEQDQRPGRTAAAQVGGGRAAPGHRGERPREQPRVRGVIAVPDGDLHEHVAGSEDADDGRHPPDHRPEHGHRGAVRRGRPAR